MKANKEIRRKNEEETMVILMDLNEIDENATTFCEMTRDDILASKMLVGVWDGMMLIMFK
jgi:dihydroxyacetone kinase DhaKLM complex PTS-EIIA-like component DhaM